MIRQCRIIGSWSEDHFVGTSPTTDRYLPWATGIGRRSIRYPWRTISDWACWNLWCIGLSGDPQYNIVITFLPISEMWIFKFPYTCPCPCCMDIEIYDKTKYVCICFGLLRYLVCRYQNRLICQFSCIIRYLIKRPTVFSSMSDMAGTFSMSVPTYGCLFLFWRYGVTENKNAVLRIRDVYPGSGFFPIPDLGSRIPDPKKTWGGKIFFIFFCFLTFL